MKKSEKLASLPGLVCLLLRPCSLWLFAQPLPFNWNRAVSPSSAELEASCSGAYGYSSL